MTWESRTIYTELYGEFHSNDDGRQCSETSGTIGHIIDSYTVDISGDIRSEKIEREGGVKSVSAREFEDCR
ncbi:hypothetical protein Tco_1337584 [Tanacetum coccineum]